MGASRAGWAAVWDLSSGERIAHFEDTGPLYTCAFIGNDRVLFDGDSGRLHDLWIREPGTRPQS